MGDLFGPAGPCLLLTGGQGAHFNTTSRPHADCAADYLRSKGMLDTALLGTVPSGHSVEDATLSLPLVLASGISHVAVVTSDFHLLRTTFIFTRVFRGCLMEFYGSRTHADADQLRLLTEHETMRCQELQARGLAGFEHVTPDWWARESCHADVEFLYDLHLQTLGPFIRQIWGWDDSLQRDLFKKQLPVSLPFTQIINTPNGPAGMVSVHRSTQEIYLENIKILPAFQGRGIGTTWVRALQSEASARKVPLRLQVFKVNDRARALFSRLGFLVAGETVHHIQMRWNSPEPHPVDGKSGGGNSESEEERGESRIADQAGSVGSQSSMH